MLKKKLIGVGMAAAMTFGFGFADKADAIYMGPADKLYDASPYLGEDGHIYANWYYSSQNKEPSGLEHMGIYKMYDVEQGVITAVNVLDDTDIIRFSEEMIEYKNQAFIEVHFEHKNNTDYKIRGIGMNRFELLGLLDKQQLDNEFDVHTYKVSWTDDNYVYLYTKNHPNPHEIKLPREGFEFLTAGDWLWAKVSEDTWEWVEYGEITRGGINKIVK